MVLGNSICHTLHMGSVVIYHSQIYNVNSQFSIVLSVYVDKN